MTKRNKERFKQKIQNMKTKVLLIVALLMCSTIGMAQKQLKQKYLKPVKSKESVSIVVDGKSRDYYDLSQKPTVIKVKGAGKLRVLSRCQFKAAQEKQERYQIEYRIDGGKTEVLKSKRVNRSVKASYSDGALGVPSTLEWFEIEFGPGEHSIEFISPDVNLTVHARFAYTLVDDSKQKWVNLSPHRSEGIVELVTKESLISYYKFSVKNPILVELHGPTTLRVFTRCEFHYKMRGAVNYRIQVKMDDQVIHTYQLSNRRSETTTYKALDNLVPGRANEFVLNIPKGKHKIEIIPLDCDKNGVICRLMIPENDVKLGKK